MKNAYPKTRRRLLHRLASWSAIGLLASAACGSTTALAGIGLAVVLDLPTEIAAGDTDRDGSITLINVNSEGDVASKNLVFDIVVTPSCGARAMSAECPFGNEDPGVLTIDPLAVGRVGTACAGTVFVVKPRSAETGEVLFDTGQDAVVLGSVSEDASARQCTIDFTFSYTRHPSKVSPSARAAGTPAASGAETTAYVAAQAVGVSGQRPAVAGHMASLRIR